VKPTSPQSEGAAASGSAAEAAVGPAATVAKTKLKKWQRIFVNRSLNMGSIRAVGYDMDHTLAMYDRVAFEALAFRETLKKFIAAGYPEELSTLTFDPNFLIRGLLVDMERGNLLKVDGHKYVKIALHGRKTLTKDMRHKLYNSESYKAANLLSVDTFFALSEVQLFAEIVDFMDRHPERITQSYREVYQDLRRFIDLSHADGSIKREVMAAPERFVNKDKHLVEALRAQVEAGKTLFLLTNSSWDYTDRIMSYALEASPDFPSWRAYFQFVIVGAGKPGFFTGSQPFYEVMTDSGLLKLHGGPLKSESVYHGGNANLFQKQAGFRGDEILFVGDHIYGDIIRSKDIVNWRTLLIVEEMEPELQKLDGLRAALDVIRQRLADREVLDEELQILRSRVINHNRQAEKARRTGEPKKAHYLLKENEKLERKIQDKQAELDAMDLLTRRLIEERQAAVHPVWGELMKVGLERSRFADQVSDYACLYTARVSNLRFYSPFKRFSSTDDLLPHDL
jgi:HAD superfamily 5'-nucleotidase-like hydrolase